jgi:hypothetical protein
MFWTLPTRSTCSGVNVHDIDEEGNEDDEYDIFELPGSARIWATATVGRMWMLILYSKRVVENSHPEIVHVRLQEYCTIFARRHTGTVTGTSAVRVQRL